MNLIDNLTHGIASKLEKSWVRASGCAASKPWRLWPAEDTATGMLRATIDMPGDPTPDEVGCAVDTVVQRFFEQERNLLLRDYCWRDRTHPRTWVAVEHALFTAPAHDASHGWVRQVVLNRANLSALVSLDAQVWRGASFTLTGDRERTLAGHIGAVDRGVGGEGYWVGTGPIGPIELVEKGRALWLCEESFEVDIRPLVVRSGEGQRAPGFSRFEVDQFFALRVVGPMTLVSLV